MFLQITNIGISAIAKLNLLEKLSLMGCNHVDDDGLANLRNGCKSLQVFKNSVVFTYVLYVCLG